MFHPLLRSLEDPPVSVLRYGQRILLVFPDYYSTDILVHPHSKLVHRCCSLVTRVLCLQGVEADWRESDPKAERPTRRLHKIISLSFSPSDNKTRINIPSIHLCLINLLFIISATIVCNFSFVTQHKYICLLKAVQTEGDFIHSIKISKGRRNDAHVGTGGDKFRMKFCAIEAD